jgi:hypothetical protein
MSKKDVDLVVVAAPPTEKMADDREPIATGQWYWHQDEDDKKKKRKYLVCVSEVGSNYFEVTRVGGGSWRVHSEHFDAYCVRETNPEIHINAQIEKHQNNVRELLDEIKRVTALLGVTPRDSIAEQSEGESTALAAAHGTADIKQHKKALVKAKEKTLPDLFKKVEEEHEQLAKWMKANLIPMQTDLKKMKTSIEIIEDRIHTVELYAGLTEELVLIQDGEAAPNDTKVSLFQRRHYMDEECLLDYQHGGMDFKKIGDFDKWLLKPNNLNRILPLDRCVVAFRIRRDMKYRHGTSLSDWIRIMNEEAADKQTFLYIRNGKKIYRMNTDIDFGEQLFPDKDRSTLLGGGKIYVETKWAFSRVEVISQREYDDHMIGVRQRRAEYEELKARYDALSEEDKENSFRILGRHVWEPHESKQYEECTPDSIYYDDAMKQIARSAMEHNRIAVVLQGLLDRSPAFHPHPPWRLWTPEGFANGIELIYDDSLAISSGDMPDFDEYRKQLARTIKRGSMVIGQEQLWMRLMAEKEDERRGRSWRSSRGYDAEYFKPYGNPGPGFIAEVKRMGRDGMVTFEWQRERSKIKWVRDPKNPGYMKEDESGLNATFSCKADVLFNVSAYTPGDYKLFFSDPRSRAKYLEWAPFMLAAEEFHATGRIPKVGHYY